VQIFLRACDRIHAQNFRNISQQIAKAYGLLVCFSQGTIQDG
jgi:hypothetical protein